MKPKRKFTIWVQHYTLACERPTLPTYIDNDGILRFGVRPREKTFSEHFADVWHSLTGR